MLFKRKGKEPHKDVTALKEGLGIGFRVGDWLRLQSFRPDQIEVIRLMDGARVKVSIEQDLFLDGHVDMAVYAILESFREQDAAEAASKVATAAPGRMHSEEASRELIKAMYAKYGYIGMDWAKGKDWAGVKVMKAPTEEQLRDLAWWDEKPQERGGSWPAIGSECLFCDYSQDPENRWKRCIFLGVHAGDAIWIYLIDENQYHTETNVQPDQFRTRDDREREEVIEAAMKVMDSDEVLTEEDAAHALYDAGLLRKGE